MLPALTLLEGNDLEVTIVSKPKVAAALILAISVVQVSAEEAPREQRTSFTETTLHPVNDEARRWKLTREEYTRYLEALEGPRGRLSDPGITPIEVLGIEATSRAERARYARMWVDMIRADTAKVLSFSRSVHDAWREVAPDRTLIDPILVARLKLQRGAITGLADPVEPSRLLMFLKTSCVACEAIAKQLVRQVVSGQTSGVDFYFLDPAGDVGRVQNWAHVQDLPLDLVRQGAVTLNFDQGEFQRFKGPLALADELPVVLKREGERYEIAPQS